MSKNFYIADQHLFHENIIRLSNRPYHSIEEMHKDMIKKWNRKVSDDDTVYILGDVSLGHSEQVISIFKKLKGKKVLVLGNHDHKCLRNPKFKQLFEEITPYKEIVDDNYRVILFHYPIEEWNGYFRNSIHLYGHVHINDGNLKEIKNRYNVGADKLNMEPCTLKEIFEISSK